MADSLDDFFAKKDKSKKKGKGRFATTDLMPVAGSDSGGGSASNVEQDDTKKTKKKKERDQSGSQGSGNAKSSQDDGDWKDYEVEEEKDYSGLRIQNLQSKAENEEAGDENREIEYTEDGTLIQRRDESGPWNKAQGTASGGAPPTASDSVDGEDAAPVPQPPAPSVVATNAAAGAAATSGESARSAAAAAAASAGATPSKYVPPSMRGRTGVASSPIGVSSYPGVKSKKKSAPNITSEEDFPSLSVMGTEKPFDMDTTSFEKVRGGGKDRDASAAAPRLELANKFDALSS